MPTSSKIRPASLIMILLLSQPALILTVTGISGIASTVLEAILDIKSKFLSAADPPPFLVTLGTGQPKLISIISGLNLV